jgi:hypothetical protein
MEIRYISHTLRLTRYSSATCELALNMARYSEDGLRRALGRWLCFQPNLSKPFSLRLTDRTDEGRVFPKHGVSTLFAVPEFPCDVDPWRGLRPSRGVERHSGRSSLLCFRSALGNGGKRVRRRIDHVPAHIESAVTIAVFQDIGIAVVTGTQDVTVQLKYTCCHTAGTRRVAIARSVLLEAFQ